MIIRPEIKLSATHVVWMPVFSNKGVKIVLESDFALVCARTSVPKISTFARRVWKQTALIDEKIPTNFLRFNQGILPSIFNRGESVCRLTLQVPLSFEESDLIMYKEGDSMPGTSERLWLIMVFAAWAQAAIEVTGWR